MLLHTILLSLRLLLPLCLTLALALVPVSAAASSVSPYGVASHLFGWEAEVAETELQMMNYEKISWLRAPVEFIKIYWPVPDGEWHLESFDRLLENCERNGVTYIPLLEWPPDAFKPIVEHLDKWEEYCFQMALRYGSRLPALEVLNEPNMNLSPEDFTKILKASAQAIRKANPDVKIIYGGLSEIPFDYIEKTLQLGAGEAFDILSIHPYRWNCIPESLLPYQLRKLRRLLSKYNLGDKPIWFTEVGYSSEPQSLFLPCVLPKLLSELEVTENNLTALTFHDPEYHYYTETHTFRLHELLPGLKAIRRITLKELTSLPVKSGEVLFMPDVQAFPGKYLNALTDFVRRGGKVLFPGGFPCYFDLVRLPNGDIDCIQVNHENARRLRIGWEAPWLKEGVVAGTMTWKWADQSVVEALPQPRFTYYFFNDSQLVKGDHFAPVIYGLRDNYRGVSAGVYHFNSDFKGKIAVAGVSWRGCTEEDQARLLPRLYLLAMAEGVEVICWHNYRATEHKPAGVEADFGLHRRNLQRKPVIFAYETLTRMKPTGSTPPEIRRRNDLYIASWHMPGGEKVFAVWRETIDEVAVTLRCQGKPILFDHMGEAIVLPPSKDNRITLQTGPGVIYLHALDELDFD